MQSICSKMDERKLVSPKTMEAMPGIDQQGLNWSLRNREVAYLSVLDQVPPYFNVIMERPNYQFKTSNAREELFTFKRFLKLPLIAKNHAQLHHGIKAISEDNLIFTSPTSIAKLNMATTRTKNILNFSSYGIDLDRKNGLLSGTKSSKRFFLYDLQQEKMLYDVSPFSSEDPINRTMFWNFERNPSILICGNSCDVYNLNTETLTMNLHFKTIGFVNDCDFSERHNLLAFAMDHQTIQLKDNRLKSKNPEMLLNGHLDFNFAVKFTQGYYLASGGQDISTRIWDIRSPSKEIFCVGGENYAVSAFEYNSDNDTLFCVESFGAFYALKMQNGTIEKASDYYFGFPSGLCLSPSKKNLYMGISAVAPGVLHFTI